MSKALVRVWIMRYTPWRRKGKVKIFGVKMLQFLLRKDGEGGKGKVCDGTLWFKRVKGVGRLMRSRMLVCT